MTRLYAKTLYAKTKASARVLFVAAAALLLSGCGGGGYGMAMPWGAPNTGIVTTNQNSIPNVAWQTAGERRDLAAQQPASAAPVAKVRVALLLPLSGKKTDLGQAMLKAAQMALFDVGSANFELIPRDTKSSGEGAAAAAAAAAADHDALILGPIFAEDVKAVKPIASAAGIPVIAFTTDWAQGGSGTYIMGFLPFAQVARVSQFAQSKGFNRFGVFAPSTEYCDVVLSTLQRTGVNLVKTGRYSPQQSDLSAIVADFVTTSTAPAGAPSKYVFNALMLPVGGENLRSLSSVMNMHGLKGGNVKLLGTGLWDDASLSTDPSLYGGWFAAPDPSLRRDFEKRYQENYGAMPPRLTSLAYDATALSAVLARAGNGYSRDVLTNPRGFAGIDGVFRFRPDGMSERGLAVLELQSGRAVVVDPAPTAFISSGS